MTASVMMILLESLKFEFIEQNLNRSEGWFYQKAHLQWDTCYKILVVVTPPLIQGLVALLR